MQIQTKGMLRLGLIAALTVSAAACASKPAYQPEAPMTEAPQNTSPPTQPAYQPPQPSGPISNAPLPGSTQDFVVNVGDRVYFDFYSFDVRADAGPVLDAQAAWLRRYPNVVVRLEGNADERGTREYNFALGARRANAVRDYLSSHGVEAGRITTVSYGKEKPIDMGSGDEADQHNRNAHTAIVGGARMN